MSMQSVESAVGRVDLSIEGMTCGGCVNTVTRVLSRVPGVSDVRVDLGRGRAIVAGTARPEDLVNAVLAAGYEAKMEQSDERAGVRNERRGGCCCG